jgi:DNA-directed RNA polymerase beta subunit
MDVCKPVSFVQMHWKSDAYRMVICTVCGRMMCHNGYDCVSCADAGRAAGLLVPYSFKLLLQEMTATQVSFNKCDLEPLASIGESRQSAKNKTNP